MVTFRDHKNRLFGARADVRTSPALLALAGEDRNHGVGGDLLTKMPQHAMQTTIVLDSSILDEHQVMEMLVELGAFQYLHVDGNQNGTKLEKAVQRFKQLGSVLVPVADITDDFPIGPTLHLSNRTSGRGVQWEWIRYLRIPEGEGKFTFALGFA